MTWRDRDAVEMREDGFAFDIGGSRWWLPHHGIFTSHCDFWAHYSPLESCFYVYRADAMRDVLRAGDFRIVYTPKKPAKPTNRGILYPAHDDPADVIRPRTVHDSFWGAALIPMDRRRAGKMAELHFVGTVFARGNNGDRVDFAEAWQDQKGNDVRLKDGRWVQVKLDRGCAESGNIYIQTHTRTAGTDWLDRV